jgi:hypothetical protein
MPLQCVHHDAIQTRRKPGSRHHLALARGLLRLRQEVAMFAVALFLTSFPTLITLIAAWLLGVAVIASLFLYNHGRIKMHDRDR